MVRSFISDDTEEASNLASQGQGKLQSRVMGKKSCRNTVPGKPSDLDYIIDPHHHCSGELILKSEMFTVIIIFLSNSVKALVPPPLECLL